MITMLYLGLAAFFGGVITGANHSSKSKQAELRACYNKLEQRYRELPRYGAINNDSYLAMGEEGTCE